MSSVPETAWTVGHRRSCAQVSRFCPYQALLSLTVIRGEVTHLHCKDSFSAKLAKIRT